MDKKQIKTRVNKSKHTCITLSDVHMEVKELRTDIRHLMSLQSAMYQEIRDTRVLALHLISLILGKTSKPVKKKLCDLIDTVNFKVEDKYKA